MTDAEKTRTAAIHAIGYLRGLSVWVWSQAKGDDGLDAEEAGYFDEQVDALARALARREGVDDADQS